MPINQKDKERKVQGSTDSLNEESNISQSQNNNGNIGREVDNELNNSHSGNKKDKPESMPNEKGIAENQEKHWTGNYGRTNSKDNAPNKVTSKKHPKKGYNHVANVGGTSEEDLGNGAETNDYTSYEEDENGHGL